MTELKINALNQLKLLKQSTFKDPLCFLDEDIQNAQRAKARKSKITTDYWGKKVVIFNNGAILDDPQKLFSIAESGWDDETVKAENPFGIGFFSNIVVSNLITIKTGTKLITFDVDKMLVENDVTVDVQELDECDSLDGFELTLHNFDFHTCSETNIKERVQTLSDFIHELDIIFNDEYLEHRELTEPDKNVKFSTSVKNDMCEGWIGASSDWSWNEHPAIYYKGRFVTNLESMPYLTGKLHINDGILNLVAPDRKDIIRDDKLNDFKEMAKKLAEEFCDKLVLDDRNDLSEYSSCVKKYFNADAVRDKLTFVTFKTKDSHAMDYLAGLADMCDSNDKIKSVDDYEVILKQENNKINGSEDADKIEVNVGNKSRYRDNYGDDERSDSSPSGSSGSTVTVSDPLAAIGARSEDTTRIESKLLKSSKEPVFYLKFKDVRDLKHKLAIARHYNLRIILARNDVEYSVLEDMKVTEDGSPVVHISSLTEDIEISGRIENITLNGKEKRAAMLFGMISTMMEYEENIFVIGDVRVTKTVEIKSINVKKTIEDANVNILYSDEHDTIFIDRKIINDRKLTPNLSSKLNLSDVQFIVGNLNNISKALVGFANMTRFYKSDDKAADNIKNTILRLISLYEPTKSVPSIDDEFCDEMKNKMTRKEKKRVALKERRLSNK